MAKKSKKLHYSGPSLFPLDDEEQNGKTVRHKSRKAVTFKGGLNKLAHRWFRLTPSYSPDVVTSLLKEYGTPGTRVLDPFSGRGTTPIQCKLEGVSCIGIEINPLLHFVGSTSLEWSVPATYFSTTVTAIIDEALRLKRDDEMDPSRFAAKFNVQFPTIHNVFRWWRPDVLRDLLSLKAAIVHADVSSSARQLLLLVLSSILLDTANITLGRLQLHFIDRASDEIEGISLFAQAAQSVCEDLEVLNSITTVPDCRIIHGNSMDMSFPAGIERESIDLVITSPPYPNRYSYVWNTRPHLYFLDFMNTPTAAATLDCKTIGGTWGTATSRHMKGDYVFKNAAAGKVVKGIVSEIRTKDSLMANYVAMYFDDLGTHISAMRPYLKRDAICAYVVGNSRIKKTIVETDTLLQSIFAEHGFCSIRLEEIRRRNSGKELHETIVISKRL